MKKIAILLILFVLSATPAHAFKRVIPFAPGEKMTYDIYWTVVRAGTATLEIQPMTDVDGQPAWSFLALARTTPFVDKFYKVRDRIEGYADREVKRSLLYRKFQREGKYKKDAEVRFNWDENKSYRYISGDLRHELDQPRRGVFDPLSSLFYFRKYIPYKTMVFGAPVTDGKISIRGMAEVLDRETVSVKAGEFECYKIRLDTKHLSGVFKKSSDASITVWLSADDRRIPVKVQSSVIVGSFSLELAEYQPGVKSAGAGE